MTLITLSLPRRNSSEVILTGLRRMLARPRPPAYSFDCDGQPQAPLGCVAPAPHQQPLNRARGAVEWSAHGVCFVPANRFHPQAEVDLFNASRFLNDLPVLPAQVAHGLNMLSLEEFDRSLSFVGSFMSRPRSIIFLGTRFFNETRGTVYEGFSRNGDGQWCYALFLAHGPFDGRDWIPVKSPSTDD